MIIAPAFQSAPSHAPSARGVAQIDAPVDVDTGLVAGLKLPKIPGLPDWTTIGKRLDELVAPPQPGTLAYKADMAVVKGAQLLRTPDGDVWARDMDQRGGTRMWFDLAKRAGASTGKVQSWLGVALLAATLAGNAAVTAVAKQRYDRPRPFVVDPSIEPPVRRPGSSSYPSGHASSAFAAARVIAVLEPSLAKEAYNLATQVAVSRVYSGVHFPTDVVAGALLGTAIAETALRAAHKRPSLTNAA